MASRAEQKKAWRVSNPEKSRAYSKKWRDANRVSRASKIREHLYGKKYGISVANYEEMSSYQKGCCAICGVTPPILCVDHDHATGSVRGLLCRKCNTGLGNFRDSPSFLMRAASYLGNQAQRI